MSMGWSAVWTTPTTSFLMPRPTPARDLISIVANGAFFSN